jgi:uncharacterized YigZ family protein
VDPDRYETLAGPHHLETPRTKGSRFIADAYPIDSAEAAEASIKTVRKTYHDATHHCFAYRLGREGSTYRSSDDGEPSGSAGVPILRQIEASGLSDILVVVTRYYGGTKLGTGGLGRAYGGAASAVLGEAKRRVRLLSGKVELAFSYEDTAPVMRLLDRFNGRITSSLYGDGTTLTVEIPLSQIEPFADAFVDELRGRGSVREL